MRSRRLLNHFCQCHWFTVALLFAVVPAVGQEDEQPYLPGLVVTYRGRDGSQVRRIEESLSARPTFGAGDVRMRDSVASVRWKGLLWAQGAGDYRLHVFADGAVKVRLAGRELISGILDGQWVSSEPISLSFDYHPLEIEVSGQNRDSGVALFWSGPQFGIEPIAPRYLWHDRKETVEPDFERGRLLNLALRCTACHALQPHERVDVAAPSLVNLSGNVHRQWMVEWLMQQEGAEPAFKDDEEPRRLHIARRMPFYGVDRDDAEAIAAFLLADRGDAKPREKAPADRSPQRPIETPSSKSAGKSKKGDKAAEQKEPPSAAAGERLLLTLGCLACHSWQGLGESGLFGGGDLTNVAAKRPAEFFQRWLSDPASLNPRHRMPTFDLSDDERSSLSLFLALGGRGEKDDKSPPAAVQKDGEAEIARGRELVLKLRCGRCHELPTVEDRMAADRSMLLFGSSDWDRSCAGKRTSAKSGWAYDLPDDAQKWLRAYFDVAKDAPEPHRDGLKLLLSSNCLACHAREGYSIYEPLLPPRLADKLAAVGQKHEPLAPLIPAMTPPSLNGIGDKLTTSALKNAISRSEPPHRSYLLVRMPKFALEHHDEGMLTGYFWRMDQVPNDVPGDRPDVESSEAALAAAGGRLVSTDGFGCVSCHQIGSVVPDKAPLNARGPNLSRIDRRIRREWFDRFMPSPARVVPRMEMPSVRIAVKGVLGDKVDAQLAAVWHVLRQSGFEPPEPNPVRVLRASGIAERKETPIDVTDVVKLGGQNYLRPILIGLPSRHNFLFDLEANCLRGWWLGDAARLRTKGKSWYWEAGGESVVALPKQSELALSWNGKQRELKPSANGTCQLADFRSHTRFAEFTYVVDLGLTETERRDAGVRMPMKIRQSLVSLIRPPDGLQGTERRLDIESIPLHSAIKLRLVDESIAKDCQIESDGKLLRFPGDGGWQIRVRAPADARILADGTLHVPGPKTIVSSPTYNPPASVFIRLDYLTGVSADQYQVESPDLGFADDRAVEIAPGFLGVRLPLPIQIMPTGFSWRLDEKLFVCTLQGQVLLVDETNPAGLKETIVTMADGLPAPYGIAAGDSFDPDAAASVDVLTKSGLLRLTYDPRHPKSPVRSVAARGWGYTDDYHDWAVGLPRNERGEYFIGLPCQQDERSAAGAKYRGAVLKLTPRLPTEENPLRYAIEVISTGHRFPMGLDLDRDGELFVTDNQGNYNPFNELNHVRPGAFFGFINASEKKDAAFAAPPLDQPAIDIPHPWTRSVNGICFLHTPQPLRQAGKDAFGPLEGHLIGCEYDTRRLVRMTLQKVGGTYQGAAYPLSLEPSSPEKGFLGPVVCAVSPRGELYVGSIRDSGWGAGNNIGEVVQIKIDPQKLPGGIAEVRATADGFTIDFFRPIDANQAADPVNYVVASYRRESTPAYGGSDLDRRIEKLGDIEVAPDRRRVTLKLPELREGFVYEFQLKNLTSDGSLFHPAEAHYTLRCRP